MAQSQTSQVPAGRPPADPNRVVNLLWTGGWDSTFRLLQLAIVERRRVQPYYIKSPKRRSTPYELAAMDNILAAIEARYGSEVRGLIAPINFHDQADIPELTHVRDAFARLLAAGHIGAQYEWLAEFTAMMGITDFELSSHRFENKEDRIRARLNKDLEWDGDAYRLSDSLSDEDLFIFSNYRFPLNDMSKSDMKNYAQEHGLGDILMLTHFCHRPDKKGRPCGVCVPCGNALVEGFAHRVPLRGRLRRLSRKLRGRL